jgi:putative exosortase-associated protein (TIGR04073 family)
MKWTRLIAVAAFIFVLSAGSAFAREAGVYRDQSEISKMMHKLGRGVTNVLTCWVEVPRHVAIEWERMDPASGLVVGTFKGVAWGFTRFSTGLYDTFTFPFPVPENYVSMIEPEFVITDIWGDSIPGLADYDAYGSDELRGGPATVPKQFDF